MDRTRSGRGKEDTNRLSMILMKRRVLDERICETKVGESEQVRGRRKSTLWSLVDQFQQGVGLRNLFSVAGG